MTFDSLTEVVGGGGLVALPAALAAGLVTGLNPCCVPMYPAAAATCCAARDCAAPDERRGSVFAAVAFALGLAVATTALGVGAAATGGRLRAVGGVFAYLVALVPLVAGAHFLGFIRIPAPRLPRLPAQAGGAFAAGLVLSLVVAPCGTPLLGSILSYAAYRGSLAYGGLLLFVYGVGLAVPVLALGLSANRVAAWLDRGGLRRWADRATGGLLVGLGLYLLWRA